MRTPRLAIASGILTLTLLASLPVQAADSNPPSYTETFEGDDSCVGGVCDPSSITYTYSKAQANAFVSSGQAQAGSLGYRFLPTNPILGNSFAIFDYNSAVNFCSGTPMKLWFRSPNLTDQVNFQTISTLGQIRILSTEAVEVGGTVVATYIPDTWADFTWYHQFTTGTSDCDGTTHNYRMCASSSILAFSFCTTPTSTSLNLGAGSKDAFALLYPDTTQAIYLDNLGPLQAFSTASANNIFCSNVIEDDTVTGAGDHPNYGYNYRRGGAYFNQEDGDVAGIGLSTGYKFEGDASEANWDYTAKDFSTGTKAVHVNMTLEAALTSSTVNSVFRVNMMTVSGANSDVNTKGNGLNTGLFSDHAEAQFAETSNAWQVSFWYVTGGGTRTQLGAAASVGSSHDATPFTIWMDTRATAFGPPDAGFQGTGGTITAGPYIAVTIPQQSTGGEDNTIVGFRSLPAAFSEDTIFNVWNVGYGSASTATTAVDENIQVGDNTDDEGAAIGKDSTCIFDDVGTAVARGSQGSAPDSTVPDFTPTPTGSSTGTSSSQPLPLGVDPTAGANAMGVSEAAYSAYLGIMYTLAIGVVFAVPAAVVAVKFGKSLKIVAWSFLAGVVLGFILTAVWGFYETWMVFAVILAMILAVIGLIALSRRGG